MNGAIGIFGGTFDPIHNGHLQVALEVQQGLHIADFRLVPAGDPPHRQLTHAGAAHRLAMLELAVVDHPGLRVDTRELDRPGPSYMVDTLASFRADHAHAPLVLVIGQDSANQFDSWHRWRAILGLAHLVVINRPGRTRRYSAALEAEFEGRFASEPGALLRRPAGRVLPFQVRAIDLSSTEVRRMIAAGEDLHDCLPAGVADYIARHRLYT